MTTTDVAAFVGDYPFRGLPHATPDWLLVQMDRLELERAWVGHLPSFLYKDPAPGNAALERGQGLSAAPEQQDDEPQLQHCLREQHR